MVYVSAGADNVPVVCVAVGEFCPTFHGASVTPVEKSVRVTPASHSKSCMVQPLHPTRGNEEVTSMWVGIEASMRWAKVKLYGY